MRGGCPGNLKQVFIGVVSHRAFFNPFPLYAFPASGQEPGELWVVVSPPVGSLLLPECSFNGADRRPVPSGYGGREGLCFPRAPVFCCLLGPVVFAQAIFCGALFYGISYTRDTLAILLPYFCYASARNMASLTAFAAAPGGLLWPCAARTGRGLAGPAGGV